MRDLGVMGESAFSLWCSSIGLVANSSKIDKTGWDFWVEFPLNQSADLPADMLPAPIECKVQVKATDQNKRKTQIAVSNLHRLAKAPVPTFICFIEFDGKNEAQAAYLVHIGKNIIEQILKRIRELEVKGVVKKLNKRSITINYSNKDKLKYTDGASLKESIERCVPQGPEEYIKTKNNLLKTLGFETGSGHFNVILSGKDPITDMVDLTLGLRKELSVDKFTGRHLRFGILSPKPFVENERGLLYITDVKPFTKAEVIFKEYEFSAGISFPTELYVSQFNKFVPDEFFKLRAKGKFFEIVVEPFKKKAHYTFCFDNENGSNLKELKDMLRVLTLFWKSPNMLELEIKPDGLPPLRAKINSNEKIDDWSDLYNIAEMAVSICHELQVQPANVKINIDYLLKYSSSIENFFKIIKGTPGSVSVEFSSEGEELRSDKKTSCIFFLQTHIGDHAIGAYVGIEGFLEILDEKYFRLQTEKIVLGPQLVAKQENDFEQKIIDNEFIHFAEIVTEKGVVPVRMV